MNYDDWATCQFCKISYPREEGRRCDCPEASEPDGEAVVMDEEDLAQLKAENERLREERDALAEALKTANAVIKEAAKSTNVNNLQRASNILANYQMDGCDPQAIIAAHDAALTGPLVEALENILECFPKDYDIRITEIAREALAPYREAKR